MSDLALYIGAIIVGYFVGSRVRSKRDSMTWTGKVQTVAITILVIAMGARMGANREVTENLGDIGVSALIMTAGVMGCTILALFLVRKVIGIDRYGIMHRKSAAGTEDDPEQAEKAAEAAVEKIEEDEKKQGASSMTLIILVSVVIGMLIGYFVIRDVFADNIAGFDTGAGLVVKAGLTVLLLFIGIDLGLEGTVIGQFQSGRIQDTHRAADDHHRYSCRRGDNVCCDRPKLQRGAGGRSGIRMVYSGARDNNGGRIYDGQRHKFFT